MRRAGERAHTHPSIHMKQLALELGNAHNVGRWSLGTHTAQTDYYVTASATVYRYRYTDKTNITCTFNRISVNEWFVVRHTQMTM